MEIIQSSLYHTFFFGKIKRENIKPWLATPPSSECYSEPDDELRYNVPAVSHVIKPIMPKVN